MLICISFYWNKQHLTYHFSKQYSQLVGNLGWWNLSWNWSAVNLKHDTLSNFSVPPFHQTNNSNNNSSVIVTISLTYAVTWMKDFFHGCMTITKILSVVFSNSTTLPRLEIPWFIENTLSYFLELCYMSESLYSILKKELTLKKKHINSSYIKNVHG